MISSSFTVRQEEGEHHKGRCVLNFHKQSKHWHKGSLKMDTITSFAVEMERGIYVSIRYQRGIQALLLSS